MQATFEGHSAARSTGETSFFSGRRGDHYRIAHESYSLPVPFMPRMLSELAHSSADIDVHAGATILGRSMSGKGATTGGDVSPARSVSSERAATCYGVRLCAANPRCRD